MGARLTDDARRLVDGVNYAVLSTLLPDGSPKSDVVWIGREDDRLLVATDANSIKARNVGGDRRVALAVTAFDNPYEQLLVRGVADLRDDDDLVVLDALSMKYLGEPFARRKWSKRVVLVIEPDVARHYVSPLRHRGGS